MVADNGVLADFNIHPAKRGTGFAFELARARLAADGEKAEQVAESEQGAEGTGVLAPGAFHEQAEEQNTFQNQQGGDGDFACPKVEQRKIRVVILKDKTRAGEGDVQHPSQNAIAQVAQNAVEFVRNELVVHFIAEPFTPQFSNPLLNCPQRADPAAENRTSSRDRIRIKSSRITDEARTF